jgi:diguanylate cyclase (GGDEF)-like protein/PAS domain S-box-containing protein
MPLGSRFMSKSPAVADLPPALDELLSLRTLLDQLGAYIYTKDTAGRYTFVNEMVCQLFGRPREQIVGRDDSHFFDLEKSNELRVNDQRVMGLGETIMGEELNVVQPSGETRIYWSVKAPVRNAAGKIVGMCGISNDITERKRLEKEVEKQQQMLDTILNNVDAYVYLKNSERRYLYVNNRTAELFGRPAEQIVGRVDEDLMPKELADNFGKLDRQVFESQSKQCGEETFRDQSGAVRHYWSIKMPIKLPDQPDALIGLSSDITELHELKEELQRQALTDALTGLHNRHYFYPEAAKQFSCAKRYRQNLSVLLLDIDLFKQINDEFGHQAGDEVIRRVAAHCRHILRGSDLLGRIGGEEFAFALPNTDADGALLLAGRLCASIRELRVRGDWLGEIAPTVSVGVATLAEQDSCFDALLARADKALYRAKQAGRDQVCQAVSG